MAFAQPCRTHMASLVFLHLYPLVQADASGPCQHELEENPEVAINQKLLVVSNFCCQEILKHQLIWLVGMKPSLVRYFWGDTAHLMSLIYFITSIWSLYPRTPVLTTLWFDEKRPTLDAMRCCHTRGSLNQSGEMSCTALRRTQSIFAQFVKVFHFPL